MAKLEWRRFNNHDWVTFCGAECYPDGTDPHTANWMLGDVYVQAIVGYERGHVVAYSEDGEEVAILSYESPLTVALLDEPLTVEQLRALPGCFDHHA